ncbi:serine integrase family protein [Desulfocastanea catecholica]
MTVFGYIFLALENDHLVAEAEQKSALHEYARTIGLAIDEMRVEEGAGLKRPFRERPEGRRLVEECCARDALVILKAEWMLSSAVEGAALLRTLRNNDIAVYCMDLGGNITVDEKRKLVVSEGSAGIVGKLLSALAVCENCGHGEAIRATKRNLKKQGRYIGGPVPFGWQVNDDKKLVENAAQQQVIQAISAMREDRWSYRDISRKLKNDYDIQLSHAGVRRVLESNIKKKAALLAARNAE